MHIIETYDIFAHVCIHTIKIKLKHIILRIVCFNFQRTACHSLLVMRFAVGLEMVDNQKIGSSTHQ